LRRYPIPPVSGGAFDELLRRLSDAGVEFVLVGGLAVNAWRVVRGTKDVDVVAETSTDNLRRLAEVAVAAGGRVQGARVTSLTSRTWTLPWARSERPLTAVTRRTRAAAPRIRRRGGLRGPRGGG
jgi:hypothetical protein